MKLERHSPCRVSAVLTSSLSYDGGMRQWLTLLLCTCFAFAQPAITPSVPVNPVRVNLSEITEANGGTLVADGDHATLRFDEYRAVVFADSNQVIVNGTDVTLPEAIQLEDGVWFAPVELLEALNLKAPEGEVIGPSLEPFALSWEELELGRGVKALHLFHRLEVGAEDDSSLMLLDYALLGKADPKSAPEVQKFLKSWSDASHSRPLFVSIAAEPGVVLPESLEFVQGSQKYTVDKDAGMTMLTGNFPSGSGVVSLPPSFDVRQPVRVFWGSSAAEYTFVNSR
jgi:hypothetical protein